MKAKSKSAKKATKPARKSHKKPNLVAAGLPELLTVEETRAYLRVSKRHLGTLTAEGALESIDVSVGGDKMRRHSLRYRRTELDRFLRSRRAVAARVARKHKARLEAIAKKAA